MLVVWCLAVSATTLGLAALPASAVGAVVPGVNLIANPQAEAGSGGLNPDGDPAPADWTTTGDFTTLEYGASGGFPTTSVGAAIGGGADFFGGGDDALSTATQTVDVSADASEIDAGTVSADLGADLGGFDTQDDDMVVTATYLSQSLASLGTLTVGPVTEAQRDGQTTLLPVLANGTVPVGTRSIQVVMTATRYDGEYDDGYADNLSLVFDPDPSTTAVVCAPPLVSIGDAPACTATVTDTASSGASTPTGTVGFTSAPISGAFGSSSSCSLQPTRTGVASCQVTFTPTANGVYAITAGYTGDSGHQPSTGTSSLQVAAPPVSTGAPKITGTTKPGRTLTCSSGEWSNDPASYAYQWYRDGTALAGATTSTYQLGTLDEGTTLTCVVTASNVAGQASATSNAVKIPIPKVPHCPGATGAMTGTTIGQIQLGMTRARAEYLYRRHSNHGKQYEDFFCLTPIGIRVGYATPKLLGIVPAHLRQPLKSRVVWASTSDPYYELDGVRPGESLTDAAHQLDTGKPFHIGLNEWYLARKSGYTAVLKVRKGVVEELGIAENALTATRADQNVLMHSFY